MSSATSDAAPDIAGAIWDELRSRVTLPPPLQRQAIRCSAGFTQAQVAAIIGVHRTQIVRWEQGQTEPGGDNRRRYSEALRAMEGAV
jgi:DNA-binding XRE family transcriptional regulator